MIISTYYDVHYSTHLHPMISTYLTCGMPGIPIMIPTITCQSIN